VDTTSVWFLPSLPHKSHASLQVYLNIVLDDAVEDQGSQRVPIGMVVIRGNAVVMLEVSYLPQVTQVLETTNALSRRSTASIPVTRVGDNSPNMHFFVFLSAGGGRLGIAGYKGIDTRFS
jgi:hypothetical protein